MAVSLAVLIVTADPNDAELMVRTLVADGFEPRWLRVDAEPSFLATLGSLPDVILCDHTTPGFDAFRALRLVQDRDLDVAFIVISATMGETLGIQAMWEGADDYLPKDRLPDLGRAVTRALEARRLRRENRRAEASLSRFVRNAVLGMYRSTLDGQFLAVNPALVKMLGYNAPEHLLRTPIERLYRHPGDLQSLVARFHTAGLVEGVEVEWVRQDGCPITVRLSGTGFTDPVAGEVFEGIVEDVTARRSLENQLRHAQKMEAVARLAGGIAHDFNNLLTAVVGYAELALGQLKPGDPIAAELHEIQSAAERASHLTRQLLAFSRKEVVAPEILNLGEILTEMEPMLRRLLGEDVKLQVGGNGGSIKADRGHLEQIIMNLAINARDAMPLGGTLAIETANVVFDDPVAAGLSNIQAGPHVQLTVSDTGCGMDADTLMHMFEPFYTTKEAGKGTGLGLSTVYGIVAQSGGRISVASEVGQGTTFRIHLPRLDATPAQEASVPAPISRRASGSETILLVEDDTAVRTLVATALRQKGYQVLEAANGEEGQTSYRLHRERIDLVVTDVVMPKVSGAALVEWLHGLTPGVRILYVSGYTEDTMLRHGVAGAGVPFLQKPFTTRALVAKVREALDMPAPQGSPVIQRACILAEGEMISERELMKVKAPVALEEPAAKGGAPARSPQGGDTTPGADLLLAHAERDHILTVLERTGGNKKAAAQLLGVSRRKLYRYLERFQVYHRATTASRFAR